MIQTCTALHALPVYLHKVVVYHALKTTKLLALSSSQLCPDQCPIADTTAEYCSESGPGVTAWKEGNA